MTREVSVHDLIQSRDCAFRLCDHEAERGSAYCRAHAGEATAAARVEQPNRQTITSRGRTWDRESVLGAIDTFMQQERRFPTTTEWQRSSLHPLYDARWPAYNIVLAFFQTWRAAMVAAGCPPGVAPHLCKVAPDGTVTVEDANARVSPAPAPAPAPAAAQAPPSLAELARRLERALERIHAADAEVQDVLRWLRTHGDDR